MRRWAPWGEAHADQCPDLILEACLVHVLTIGVGHPVLTLRQCNKDCGEANVGFDYLQVSEARDL